MLGAAPDKTHTLKTMLGTLLGAAKAGHLTYCVLLQFSNVEDNFDAWFPGCSKGWTSDILAACCCNPQVLDADFLSAAKA